MAPLTGPLYTERRGGASQARASESQEHVVWYGGENANQDVCIRFVCDTINNYEDDDGGRTLAHLMVHSRCLKASSTYFATALNKRWTLSKRKRSPVDLTFYIHGDVQFYTKCISTMYNPIMVGFESVEYSLHLLAAATHLACDDVIGSIYLYLASVFPWSDEDEMEIRSSVFSEEDFPPPGHAHDLLERLIERLSRGKLPPHIRPLMGSFITRFMDLGMESFRSDASSFSSRESSIKAKELLHNLVVTARGQERNSTPTFEQEAVSVINEQYKLVFVGAEAEVEAINSMGDNSRLLNAVCIMQQGLDMFSVTGMTDEAMKCFAQYKSFSKLLEDALSCEDEDVDVMIAVDTFTYSVVRIMNDLLSRNVHPEDSGLDALLLNWLPVLNWLHNNADEALGGMTTEFREECAQVKKTLLSTSFTVSSEVKKFIDTILAL